MFDSINLHKFVNPTKERGWLKKFWQFSLYYGEYMAKYHRKTDSFHKP